MRRTICLVSFSLLLSAVASATGKIVIYRPAVQLGGLFHESVFLNEKRIAKLCNGCYIEFELPAGEYRFRSNDKKRGVALNVENGKTYYMRVSPAGGKVAIQTSGSDEARYELALTKRQDCSDCPAVQRDRQ